MASASSPSSIIKVAVTQAEPVWLDLGGCVDKTCRLIVEAAAKHAKVISFPECWIPGYPAWIWSRPVDMQLSVKYTKNSLRVESEQMAQICQCAADNNMVVILGFSENHHNTLYISQAIIDADGALRVSRRKIKATHMERTIFGDAGAECLETVSDTKIARVGALSCWEHVQPLLKYHTYNQREQLHVAAWPPTFDHSVSGGLWSMSRQGSQNLSRTYAIESQSFVLHTTAIISEKGVSEMSTHTGTVMNSPGGGNSAVFGPDGRKLTEDIPETEEGIIYADLDLDQILECKGFLDLCGHYSRPDLLWAGVDAEKKKHVR